MFTKKVFWTWGFWIHCGIVLLIALSAYFGVLPISYKGIPRCDLVGHTLLIGLLAFFLDGVLQFRPLIPNRFTYIRRAPVIILGIAAVEEFGQSFSPFRSASWDDLFADTVGIVFFSWLAKYLAEKYKAKEVTL